MGQGIDANRVERNHRMIYRKYETLTEDGAEEICNAIRQQNANNTCILFDKVKLHFTEDKYRIEALMEAPIEKYKAYEVYPNPKKACHYFMGQRALYEQAYKTRND